MSKKRTLDNEQDTNDLFCSVKKPCYPTIEEVPEAVNKSIMSKEQDNLQANKELLQACKKRNLNSAQNAIDMGADVDAKDEHGKTPLHHTSEAGPLHFNITQFLLDKGADVNAKDIYGFTALHCAAGKGNLDITQLLVKNGADVNAKDTYGFTALHCAAGNGNLDITQLLVKNGADVNAKDSSNCTPLDYLPISHTNIKLFESLIENGAIVTEEMLTIQRQEKNISPHLLAALWCQNARMGQIGEIAQNLGEDPIIPLLPFLFETLWTIMKGQLVEGGSIAKLLELQNIQSQIVQNIINTNNFVGKTTQEIIEKHALRLFNSILSGKAHDKPGLDTLSLKEREMVVNKVKSLCNENQDITITNEKLSKVFEGNSVPEHMKQELQKLLCHNEEVLLPTIEEAPEAVKESIMSKELYNYNPNEELILACEEGDLNSAKHAIKMGADNIRFRDKDGLTIFYYAAKKGNLEITRLLIEEGADVNAPCTSSSAWTPLHYASQKGYSDIARLFVAKGANVNATNQYGITPLHNATRFSGDLDLIQFLVAKGANVNAKDIDNRTPLHEVTRFRENPDVIQLLQLFVKNGADVNAKDIDNRTPLDYLPLSHKNTKLFESLIENGAIVTEEMLATQKQKGNISPHLLAALSCQDLLSGKVTKIPFNFGENQIPLLAKIMKGQLVEGGSIETLNGLLDINNSDIQKIIQNDDFFGKTTQEIIEKHGARLYNSILSGKVHDTPNLDTFTEEEQDMVVNKVTSLCNENEDITIDNEKLSKALESNNVPNHLREALQKIFHPNEELLLPTMEVESEAVVDEVSFQIEPAAGTSAEISNNHGWEVVYMTGEIDGNDSL